MGRPRLDLTNQRFGRLVTVRYSHSTANVTYWVCKCDCGNERIVARGSLRSGLTKSCGCLRVRHGLTIESNKRKPTYAAWQSAKQRCTNPKHPGYHNYGGRGIEMRFESIEALVADIGENPVPGVLTLDRINNDGHYEAGNVRWADRKTQTHNRRSTNPKGTYAL